MSTSPILPPPPRVFLSGNFSRDTLKGVFLCLSYVVSTGFTLMTFCCWKQAAGKWWELLCVCGSPLIGSSIASSPLNIILTTIAFNRKGTVLSWQSLENVPLNVCSELNSSRLMNWYIVWKVLDFGVLRTGFSWWHPICLVEHQHKLPQLQCGNKIRGDCEKLLSQYRPTLNGKWPSVLENKRQLELETSRWRKVNFLLVFFIFLSFDSLYK